MNRLVKIENEKYLMNFSEVLTQIQVSNTYFLIKF